MVFSPRSIHSRQASPCQSEFTSTTIDTGAGHTLAFVMRTPAQGEGGVEIRLAKDAPRDLLSPKSGVDSWFVLPRREAEINFALSVNPC